MINQMCSKILVVGSGLFGATVARIALDKGYSVTVLERDANVGGNIRTVNIHDIDVHIHGAHIFHTNNKSVWDFVNNYAEFNNFVNSPIAIYKNKLYNLPFNMNTFYQLWGCTTPDDAKSFIESQRGNYPEPKNLEEQALNLVGRDVYNTLIKGYTEKQWGKPCNQLPADIIKRLPVRFTYDNNYFNARYQGVPINGYTNLIKSLLKGANVITSIDYLYGKGDWNAEYDIVIYTGPIDEYFNYRFGHLEYRSLRFTHYTKSMENFQGNAVINYTDADIPYTRVIEHKHFTNAKSQFTVVTEEYPQSWCYGKTPYYPINDSVNEALADKYRELTLKERNVYFCGRLGQYKYYDMDKTVESAMSLCEEIL